MMIVNEDLLNVMGSFSETALDCIEKQNEEIEDLKKENARLKEKNEKFEEWLKYKAEALDAFDIPKRKETGAFWFTTRGEIDGLLELIKEN
jgi:hypothetical protein